MNCLKARIVVKSYKYKLRIDYFEVFILVTRMDTLWMIIALVA